MGDTGVQNLCKKGKKENQQRKHRIGIVVQSAEQQFENLLREYYQVRDDVAQGLGFYGQLQEAVKQLHQEVGDFCLSRSAFEVHVTTVISNWLTCTCMNAR